MFDVPRDALRQSKLFWLVFWPIASLAIGIVALYFATSLNQFGDASDADRYDAMYRSYYALTIAGEVGFLWWFASWLKSRHLMDAVFEIRPTHFVIETGYGLVLYGISLVFAIAAVEMIVPALPIEVAPSESRYGGGGVLGILLVSTTVVIFAPLVEEFIMRGWLLPKLAARMGGWVLPIIISATAFGLMHILVDIPTMIYTTVLGIFAGLARRLTGRLWAPIILHLVNNTVASLPF